MTRDQLSTLIAAVIFGAGISLAGIITWQNAHPPIDPTRTWPSTPSIDKTLLQKDPAGGTYPVDLLNVVLADGRGARDAMALASSVQGSVEAYVPAVGAYVFELPTRSVDELNAVRATLTKDARVSSVFPMYMVAHDSFGVEFPDASSTATTTILSADAATTID